MSAHTPCDNCTRKTYCHYIWMICVSEESGTAIEQHLKSCPDCHEYYEHMKSELLEEQAEKQTETQREINYLKNIKQHTTKKLILGTVSDTFPPVSLLSLSSCLSSEALLTPTIPLI